MRQSNRVLLVNPNLYRHPPVPPIGLEHLSAYVKGKGYEARIVDLCFVDKPWERLRRELEEFPAGTAGFTVRNIDSVLYPGTEFFLPAIRELVSIARNDYGCLTVVGGAGVGAQPLSLCAYLGADVAVEGPGEEMLARVLEGPPEDYRGTGRVLRGDVLPAGSGRDLQDIDYRVYHDAGAIPGFRTHSGCSGRCVYCLEARTPVAFRSPGEVVTEIRTFMDAGYPHFHLCDPEFNEDLAYGIDFLKRIIRETPGMKWALYMKPGTYSSEMFELLARSGAYLVTLSVCSWKRDRNYWSEVGTMARLARDNGIRMVFDVMTGFPYERADDLTRLLDRVRSARPDEAVINVYLRLYDTLPVTDLIRKDPLLGRHVIGSLTSPLLEPVFYNHLSVDTLRKAIAGDPLFRVCGETKGVNYQAG